MKHRFCQLMLLALTAAAAAGENRFAADCAALTAAPHRLSGTAEYQAAAGYLVRRLEAVGADVVVQEFPSAQSEEQCTLEIPPTRRPLYAMRPNGIVPPSTPAEGITGQILHAGAGGLDAFGDRSPQGKLVVMDYNCGRSWLRAFRLGAKAAIFVPNGPAEASQCHHTIANANLPRFYHAGQRSDLPEGATATIRSQTPWRGAVGRNVLAFLKGTNAKFDQDAEEMLLVACNLDTFGEVPRLSPGARGAANCAALLRLAEHLKANPPRRHVLLAFLDTQARSHAGAAALYRVLDQASDATIKLENRAKSLETEDLFLADMRSLLAQPDPLAADSPVRREMVLRLKRNAAAHSFELRQALYDLRKAQAARGRDAATDARIAEKEAEKGRWNALLRVLSRRRDTREAQDILPAALAELRGEVTRRSEELEAERRALLADQRLHELVGKLWVSLHVSLLLGDASPQWGLVIGGDSAIHIPGDDPGLYGKVQTTFLRAAESLDDSASPPRHFERASADGTLDPPRLLWAAPFLIHSGEVAGRLGIYNLALATAQESLPREGTPDDTLAALGLSRIEAQAAEACSLLAAVASHQGLSLRRGIVADAFYSFPEFPSDYHPRGPMAMGRLPGSPMPDRQMPHAIVRLDLNKRGAVPWTDLAWQPQKPHAFDDFIVLRTNQNGSYGFGPVRKDTWNLTGFAAGFDPDGQVSAASDVTSAGGVATRLNMFQCRSGAAVLPPQLQPNPIQALRARGNSPLDDDRSFTQTLDGLAYWYCETKEDTLKLFGLRALVALGSGGNQSAVGSRQSAEGKAGSPEEAEGVGFSTEPPWALPSTARLSAGDLWRLNEARMQVLRSRGIVNSSVEQLHGEAEDLLLAAATTPAVGEAEAIAASAFLAEQPVYEITRDTLNDLVRAVLVLLGLSVPFAFAAERLLVGATNVYRQLAWFAAFFTLTFLILFFTHPAFAISQTPTIIFLGFAVVVLAALVIVMIMRRFEVELKILQGLTSTVHAADVSRFSTVMAAMAMGISTMRRRPLRTALTAITIVMLTFTILCFASFGTQTGIVKLFVGASPGYSGAFLHKVSWTELSPDLLDVIRPRWGKAAVACNRLWISPKTPQNQGPLITRADGTRPLALRGVLGLDAREFAHRPDRQTSRTASSEPAGTGSARVRMRVRRWCRWAWAFQTLSPRSLTPSTVCHALSPALAQAASSLSRASPRNASTSDTAKLPLPARPGPLPGRLGSVGKSSRTTRPPAAVRSFRVSVSEAGLAPSASQAPSARGLRTEPSFASTAVTSLAGSVAASAVRSASRRGGVSPPHASGGPAAGTYGPDRAGAPSASGRSTATRMNPAPSSRANSSLSQTSLYSVSPSRFQSPPRWNTTMSPPDAFARARASS